jgi:RNA polymerase sigma-70 factor (ECF subfamily)
MAASPVVLSRSDAAEPSLLGDWSRFYDEHFDFVWRSLRRLGVPLAALDDAAQEVFVVAFRRRADFEGRSSLKTWLFGIAWNRARELSRVARRRPEEPLVDDSVLASEADQEQAAIHAEALRFVYRVLDELTPERRAVLVMAEVEEMTAPEMAEVLAIPLNTVYSRIRLARRDFEAALKRCRAREHGRRP